VSVLGIVLSALAGYVVGGLSAARLVSRLVAPGEAAAERTELRLPGSEESLVLGTVSASSVSRQHGARWGFVTYWLDVLKVAAPVAVLRHLAPEVRYDAVFATAALLGHVWPAWHRFRGGRGLSVVYGSLLVWDWVGMLVTSTAGMLFGLFVARSVVVMYMAGVWFTLPWLLWRPGEPAYVAFALVANVVFPIAILPELRQWWRIRRDGKWGDPAEVMQLSGMGRGILKMAKRFGLLERRG
jgi:glycerol-3-phosphate acyltransferase PlsY